MNSVVVPSFQMDDLATAVLEYDHEFDILAIRFGEPERSRTSRMFAPQGGRET